MIDHYSIHCVLITSLASSNHQMKHAEVQPNNAVENDI